MSLNINTINKLIKPMEGWEKIEKEDYDKYGVVTLNEAKAIISYRTEGFYGQNTVTLYDYGQDEDFIPDLKASYQELFYDIGLQDEYGVFPVYWEDFGKGNFLSVLKLTYKPVMNIVDLFFNIDNNIYAYHTYLPKEENKLDIKSLKQKYYDINFIVEKLNDLQK